MKKRETAGCNNIPPEATKTGGEVSKEVYLGIVVDIVQGAGTRGVDERFAYQTVWTK